VVDEAGACGGGRAGDGGGGGGRKSKKRSRKKKHGSSAAIPASASNTRPPVQNAGATVDDGQSDSSSDMDMDSQLTKITMVCLLLDITEILVSIIDQLVINERYGGITVKAAEIVDCWQHVIALYAFSGIRCSVLYVIVMCNTRQYFDYLNPKLKKI